MGYKIDQLDDLVTIALNFYLKFIGLSSPNMRAISMEIDDFL